MERKVAKHLSIADSARDRRDWASAERSYGQVLQLDGSLSAIWVQLGHSLKEQGKLVEAQEAYLTSLNLAPSESDTHLQLGHLLKLKGTLDEAAYHYYKATLLNENNRDAQRELSALRAQGVALPRTEHLPPTPLLIAPASHKSNRAAEYTFDCTLAGKLGTNNGIALHTSAFLHTLQNAGLRLQVVDTRPQESDESALIPFREKITQASFQEAQPSAVSVFCDVIANSPTDTNFSKIPDALVRVAFAVFDSSRIPQYWVERLNTFDLIAVPDPFLVDTLEQSGVTRPVFVLPLALDYSHLDAAATRSLPTESRPFTFGCIAGFGLRKNLQALIDTFSETFGNNEDVCLDIHSTLNFSSHFEHLQDYIKVRGSKNIRLTCTTLRQSDYAALLKSFDVYVNVSKGEGYSITPREALYLGIPTLLSDNSAHRTLISSNLAVPVPTKLYEPATYESLGDQTFGIQAAPDLDVLRVALVNCLRNNREMRSKARDMREFAEKFSVRHLEWHYRSLVSPKDVFLSRRNKIHPSHIETTDPSLVGKYQSVIHNKRSKVDPGRQHRLTVIGHDAGFFSVFNSFLSYLVWNHGRPEVTSILPDWRISKIAQHRNKKNFTSFCYGKRADGNLWLKFFHPLPGQPTSERDYNDASYLDNAEILDGYNEQSEPLLTYIHAYQLYRKPDFPEWRRWYNHYFRRYTILREHISAEAEAFAANHFDCSFIVGCHVRHPSHAMEQPGRQLPTVELFQQHVIRRIAGKKDFKVFLATDQESVIESFQRLFGDRLIHRSNVIRATKAHDEHYQSLPDSEKYKEGHQIQHLMASDEANWSTRMGEEVIIDVLLLSKCHSFIHVTSNIATAVSFINPEIEMIYCE